MSRTMSPRWLLFFLMAAAAPTVVTADEPDSATLFAKLDRDADGQLTSDEVSGEHRLLFKRLLRTGDEDRDGQLSAEEFAMAIQPVRAEKESVEKQGSRLPGADALLVVLGKMDANGDQQLDAQEIPADYRATFDRMTTVADGDKDGRLDRRELAVGAPRLTLIANLTARRMGLDIEKELERLPADTMASMEQMDAYPTPGELLSDPEQVSKLFARLDADGDRQLVASEFVGPFAERSRQLIRRGDRNGDGQLNRREFLDAAERISRFVAAENRNDRARPAMDEDSRRQERPSKLKAKPRSAKKRPN